jgi:putative RNA 2'-phosphotransferase
MTTPPDLRRLSRHMSRILRHAAPELGLVVDPEGYVPVADLLALLAPVHPGVDAVLLAAVIAEVEPDKQRFHLAGDWIRANYGHTLAQRIAHTPATPPATLFHGTTNDRLAAILAHGLKPMQRQYVHLTTDVDLALRVGARHGAPCLVRVAAGAAHAAGAVFFEANERFWLCDRVAAEWLQVN